MSSQLDQLVGALADRYVVERELGRGGTAAVYLARDRRHQRHVAVKVLSAAVAATLGRTRFLREIETVAQLTHPHILPLIDSGECDAGLFYVMPYVDGQSLRDRLRAVGQLEISEAVEITSDIASALDYAHRRKVVHRDIKPENILLHEAGAILTDFGIALGAVSAQTDRITESGIALGTPEYESPEQAAGARSVDARSDVYSLACVTYEMLTGAPPFTGPSTRAVLARHIIDPVPPISTVRPTVGKTMARAVVKALNKVPADRFNSAGEFARALAAAPSAGNEISSIAVLPLTNLSHDPDEEYFSDGMTEALIAELAKVRALKVISRTSAMRFKNSDKPLPEIARELGVDVIVEGSVQRFGDQVRITAQLIDATSDLHLWAETYDRSITNVLALQVEVARAIVDQVKVKLTYQEEARLVVNQKVNPVALDAYLRGRYRLNKPTPTDLTEAIKCFGDALANDGTYALAYSGMANAYNYLGWLGGIAGDVFPKAKEAARKALELDETLPEAHAVLGYTATFYDWDWYTAERELKRALELNPNYAEGYLHYSWYLGSQGQFEEARAAISRASELDPLSLVIHANMANYLGWIRDFEGQLDQTRRTLELAPDLPLGLLFCGLACCALGRYDEGAAELQRLVSIAGSNFKGYVAYALGRAGRVDECATTLAEIDAQSKTAHVPSFQIALAYIGLGETDRAMDWIEKAFIERSGPWFPYVRVDPLFDSLRDNPRFVSMVESMNFTS